ncbi:hypothetical protein D3C76_1465480 [compost metagenome]
MNLICLRMKMSQEKRKIHGAILSMKIPKMSLTCLMMVKMIMSWMMEKRKIHGAILRMNLICLMS